MCGNSRDKPSIRSRHWSWIHCSNKPRLAFQKDKTSVRFSGLATRYEALICPGPRSSARSSLWTTGCYSLLTVHQAYRPPRDPVLYPSSLHTVGDSVMSAGALCDSGMSAGRLQSVFKRATPIRSPPGSWLRRPVQRTVSYAGARYGSRTGA